MAMPSNLPCERRGHIGAILLELQLRLDADVFEIALDQLHGIEQVRAIATGDRERRFKALGKPGFASKRRASLRIVLIVLRPGAELIDGQRPLGQATGDRRGRLAPGARPRSISAWRSMAWEMARRTRTSLKGG